MKKLLGKDAYRAAAYQTHKRLVFLKIALKTLHNNRGRYGSKSD